MKVEQFFSLLIGFSLVLILTFHSGCKKIEELNSTAFDAVQVLEDGIETIEEESSAWRSTLEDIVDELPEEIENSVENIKEQTSQLLAEGIGMTSSNVICVADAVPKRVVRGLKILVAKLKNSTPEKLMPTICQTSIAVIDFNKPFNQREKIVLYGYDFKEDESLSLWHRNATSNIQYKIENKLFKISDYQYSIVLDGLDHQLKISSALVLKFEDEVLSEFGIINNVCGSINCNEGECRNGICDCPDEYTGDRCQTPYKFNVAVNFHTFQSKRDMDDGGIFDDGDEYRMTINTKVTGYDIWTIKYNKDGQQGRVYDINKSKNFYNVPFHGNIIISSNGYEDDDTLSGPDDTMGDAYEELEFDVNESFKEYPIIQENNYYKIIGTLKITRVP